MENRIEELERQLTERLCQRNGWEYGSGDYDLAVQDVKWFLSQPEIRQLFPQPLEEKLPKCGICGGVMSKNPHPDAGKPGSILSVGAEYECIPCDQRALHNWADRARRAEGAIEGARRQERERVKLQGEIELKSAGYGGIIVALNNTKTWQALQEGK